MTTPPERDFEDFHRATEVSLARIEGLVALGDQRLEQQEQRVSEAAARLNRHGERLDAVERDQVTRTDLADRTRQIISVVAALCTAASVVVAVIAIVK